MADRPHLVILMADQLRFDALGEHTPNINRLLAQSFRFERAYCPCPLCAPARGSFFTGLYPNETGSIINPWEPVIAEYGDVRAGTPNLYTMLETDWDSWHCGKQHLYTAEKMHLSPHTKTHWITIESDYPAFLRERGERAPGGPEFRGLMPEMLGGRITRLQRYSIPKVARYEPGFDTFFDGYIANQSVEAIRNRDLSKPFLLNAMFVVFWII